SQEDPKGTWRPGRRRDLRPEHGIPSKSLPACYGDRRRRNRRPTDPEIPLPLLPWNSPAPGEPGRLGEAGSVGARSRSRWDFRAENRIGGQGIPEESKNRRRRDRRAEDLGENVQLTSKWRFPQQSHNVKSRAGLLLPGFFLLFPATEGKSLFRKPSKDLRPRRAKFSRLPLW